MVDNSIAWLKYPLMRRGFKVIYFKVGIPDHYIVKIATINNCIVITRDRDFLKYRNVVYIPEEWIKKYNSWDLTTKVIKEASLILRGK